MNRAAILSRETLAERIYRAELARAWRDYRETRHLPIAHEYAAQAVRKAVLVVRAYASRRGASRPPFGTETQPQYQIAAE